MKTTFKFTFIAILSMLFLISCEGAQGPQGVTGPQGPAGADGENGTTNIITYQFTVNAANWYIISGQEQMWAYDNVLPGLTQDILMDGTVLIYWSQGGSQTLMPFTMSTIDFMYYTTLFQNGGAFQVQVSKRGAYQDFTPSNMSPVVLKVIIIPND